MLSLWLLLHIVGVILWFSTLPLEAFVYPAARKAGDSATESWIFRVSIPAYYVEVVGLGLLLAGGIGRWLALGWGFLEFKWLIVKVVAAAIAIFLRAQNYHLIMGKARSALKGQAGSVSDRLVPVAAAIERAKLFPGLVGFVGVIVVFWMVLWRPWG